MIKNDDGKRYVSVNEAAAVLGCHEQCIRNRMTKGKFVKAVRELKHGRKRVFFLVEDILKFAKEFGFDVDTKALKE